MSKLKELINEHNKVVKEWIKEGKFNSHAEMVYAQNLSHLIAYYEQQRDVEDREFFDPAEHRILLPPENAG